jgi:hypothetical protein
MSCRHVLRTVVVTMRRFCRGFIQFCYCTNTDCCFCVCCVAPNILAGLSSKGEGRSNVGIYGTLGPAGFSTTIFAASKRTQVPQDRALPTTTLLGVSNGVAARSNACEGCSMYMSSCMLFTDDGCCKLQ